MFSITLSVTVLFQGPNWETINQLAADEFAVREQAQLVLKDNWSGDVLKRLTIASVLHPELETRARCSRLVKAHWEMYDDQRLMRLRARYSQTYKTTIDALNAPPICYQVFLHDGTYRWIVSRPMVFPFKYYRIPAFQDVPDTSRMWTFDSYSNSDVPFDR